MATGGTMAAKVEGKIGGRLSLGTIVNYGLPVIFGISDYKTAREEGHGRIGSVAKAGASYAVNSMIGLKGMLAFSLLPTVPSLAVGAIEGIGKMERKMNSDARRIPFNNSTFNDYKQAYTMRQAGMQLAQNSQYNLQQTLMGNEAAYLNR